MASAYKVLGQVQTDSTLASIIGTVPAGKSYVVSSLVAHCQGNTLSSTNFLANVNIYAVPSTGFIGAGQENAILYKSPLEVQSTTTFTLGLTLGQGDSLMANTEFVNSNVTFTAFGEEVTA